MSVQSTSSYRLEGLTKVFPGVRAVDGANLEVRRGEIHGIIGKNGAGKSVLVSMIAGVIRPTGGTIWIGDRRVDSDHYTPAQAHELGVSLIPQEPLFAPHLGVVDNIFMGRPLSGRLGLLNHAEMTRQVRIIAGEMGVRTTPDQKMSDLAIEDQQLLAFGKALFVDQARVILLDEITASLSRVRKDQLLRFLREAVRQAPDLSFTLISHHISEIMEFCDRVTVMRDGRAMATLKVPETTKEDLARAVVGNSTPRAVSSTTQTAPAPPPDSRSGVVLAVRGLTREPAFSDVSFDLSIGEVVGLAGLDGSGKDEVLGALFGLVRPERGTIELRGAPVRLHSPGDALAHGIKYLPKKREEQGVIHNRSVEENILLPVYHTLRSRVRLIDYRRGRRLARGCVEDLRIKTPSLETNIDHLSGGNRQKTMIGRITTTVPLVFLLHEPTRGVDLATKPEILRVLRNRLSAASGVIVTSESEEELIEVCDRILIFYRGRIRRILRRNEGQFSVSEVYRGIQGIGLP